MNADIQRILDKATELLDMITAVQNKWAAQGRAGDVRKLIEAEATIRAALNGTAQPPVTIVREYPGVDYTTESTEFMDEQSPDKPEPPKRGKR
jgi:hypothetical protein